MIKKERQRREEEQRRAQSEIDKQILLLEHNDMLKAIEESKNEANAVKAQAQDEPPPI